MNEFNLIEKYFKPLASHKAAQNLADDVAKISLKAGEELVVSKDVFVEDVHFLKANGGFKIASKLLRTNLSDLAASGATPLYYMLGFSKNKKTDEKFIAEFSRGLKSVQNEFKLSLIGGDTVNSEKLFFSVTVFGVVKKGQNLSRQNAKSGDLIFVSGTIGDAFFGLQASLEKLKLAEEKYHHLRNIGDGVPRNAGRDLCRVALSRRDKSQYFLERHFFPTPRIELGKELLKQKISNCAIDVSDGLLSDLRHICKASKLSAEIYQNKIPFSKKAKKILTKNYSIKALDLLSAGDDYELIFTSAKKNLKKISALAKSLELNLTCIGEMKKSQKKSAIILLDESGKKIEINKFGYEHF